MRFYLLVLTAIIGLFGRINFSMSSPDGISAPASASYALVAQTANFTVYKNGSFDEETTTTWQALDDIGRVHLSLQNIFVNSEKEKLTVTGASIIESGQETVIPISKIVTKQVSNSKLGLNNTLQITIPFEGVKVGTKIRYSYVRKFLRPSAPGTFDLKLIYGLGFPEGNSITTIKSQIPLDFQIQDFESKLKMTQSRASGWDTIAVKTKETIYSVSQENLKNQSLRPDQIGRIPRVQIAAQSTWDDLQSILNRQIQASIDTPLGPTVSAFLKTLQSKTPHEKAAMIRGWISANITYSGRWISANSDWIPRPVNQIVTSKVGDCKDFAALMIAMLRKAAVPADLVVVKVGQADPESEITRAPLNKDLPLPSPAYFDHAVVRVFSGEDAVYIDPTINLSQATMTDYHLNKKTAWVLAPGEKYKVIKIKKSLPSSVTTRLNSSLGGFQAASKFSFQGTIVQYLNSVRFGSQPEKFAEVLATLAGFSSAQQIKVVAGLNQDRSLTNQSFAIEYFVNKQFSFQTDSTIKYESQSSLSTLGLNGQANGSFYPILDFPFEMNVTTDFPRLYAVNENESDCLAFGPLVKFSRRIANTATGISIFERSRFEIEDLGEGGDSATVFSSHIGEIKNCMSGIIAMKVLNPQDKSQVRLDEHVDANPDRVFNPKAESFRKDLVSEWRRLQHLSEKFPMVAVYRFQLARVFYRMGMVNSALFVPAYLDESKVTAQEGLKIDPNNAMGWSILGFSEIFRGKTPEAIAAFQKAIAIDPKNFFANRLAGEIADRNQKYDNAIRYFQISESVATNDVDRAQARDELMSVYCRDAEHCKEAEPILDKYVAAVDLDAWQLSNYASYYSKMGRQEKAIPLLRRSLEKMKFGVGSRNLRITLARSALDRMKQEGTNPRFIEESEAFLQEANSLDEAQSEYIVQYASAKFFAAKCRTKNDQTSCQQAGRIIARLANLEGANANGISSLQSELNRVAAIQDRRTRMPANQVDSSYDEYYKRYKADIEKPGGKEYDTAGTRSFGPTFNRVIPQCFLSGKFEIDALLIVDSNGSIVDWKNKIDSSDSLCLKEKMKGSVGQKPPFAPYHLWVHLRVH